MVVDKCVKVVIAVLLVTLTASLLAGCNWSDNDRERIEKALEELGKLKGIGQENLETSLAEGASDDGDDALKAAAREIARRLAKGQIDAELERLIEQARAAYDKCSDDGLERFLDLLIKILAAAKDLIPLINNVNEATAGIDSFEGWLEFELTDDDRYELGDRAQLGMNLITSVPGVYESIAIDASGVMEVRVDTDQSVSVESLVIDLGAVLPAETELSIISRGKLTGTADSSARTGGAYSLTLEGDVFAWIHGGDGDLDISIPLTVAIPAMVTSNFDKIILFGGDEPVARAVVLPVQSSPLGSATLTFSFCSRLVEGEMALMALRGGVPGAEYTLYRADELAPKPVYYHGDRGWKLAPESEELATRGSLDGDGNATLRQPLGDSSAGSQLWFQATVGDGADRVITHPIGQGVVQYFRRGDVDGDGDVDLVDAIFISESTVSPSTVPGCLDAADVNDDGEVNLEDASFLLDYIFDFGTNIPAPGPEACAIDETIDYPQDDLELGCIESPGC